MHEAFDPRQPPALQPFHLVINDFRTFAAFCLLIRNAPDQQAALDALIHRLASSRESLADALESAPAS